MLERNRMICRLSFSALLNFGIIFVKEQVCCWSMMSWRSMVSKIPMYALKLSSFYVSGLASFAVLAHSFFEIYTKSNRFSSWFLKTSLAILETTIQELSAISNKKAILISYAMQKLTTNFMILQSILLLMLSEDDTTDT